MAECLFWSSWWQSEGRLCSHSLSVQPDQEWTWSQWRPYHQHRWGDWATSHWLTACHSILQYITVLCSTLQNTVYFTLHVTHNHYHPYLALFSDSSQGFFVVSHSMRAWLLHATGLPWLQDFRVHAVLYVCCWKQWFYPWGYWTCNVAQLHVHCITNAHTHTSITKPKSPTLYLNM